MTAVHVDHDGRRPGTGPEARWTKTSLPSSGSSVGACERAALGTTARIVVWPRGEEDAACVAVDRVLHALDRQVSRFRPDSELARAEGRGGRSTLLSQGAADALTVALAAAWVSGGRVDPTVGAALCGLGYDRDFAEIDPHRPRSAPRPAPGWRAVHLSGRVLRLAPGVRLDLGATAKGLGADRAAWAAFDALHGGGGVLVSLGGDLAVAGVPPQGGWPVGVSEDPALGADGATQVVRIHGGGLATSSVLHRRWKTGRTTAHHIVDPATGEPAAGPWRTATVAARTCVEANVASTTAIVAGDAAEAWLSVHGLAARLVDVEGRVRLVGDWPRQPGGHLPPVPPSIFGQREGPREGQRERPQDDRRENARSLR